jgi:2-polyprenyl-6-methoxyphenol hydroxylase-like FAD-dependent oxidoreductase
MNIDKAAHTDVVVVGGGPVGMGLAIDLAQRDVSVVVVERYPQPQRIPKGQNLTQRTMEHMHAWGVEDAMRAARPIPKHKKTSGGVEVYDTLFSGYAYDLMKRDIVEPYYFCKTNRLPQYETERVLRDRASGLGVDVRYGWKGHRIESDADGATVFITEADGESEATIRAKYVVGCDGTKSTVREQAGIIQSYSDHGMLMVLLVFRSHELRRMLDESYPGKMFFNVLHSKNNTGGYWFFFGRVGPDDTFFFHAPVPLGTTADNFNFEQLLFDVVGRSFDVDISYTGFWDMRVAVANTYRSGRVFIAGDAAHSHPPYGGYGINTGLEDARNLAWKLAASVKGWGGEALLHSYSKERYAIFRSLADKFIEGPIFDDRLFLQMHSPAADGAKFDVEWAARERDALLEVDAFEPSYDGSPVIATDNWMTPTAVGRHNFSARAGHHLAPAKLASGEEIFGRLGRYFTLLALGASEQDVSDFEAAALKLRIPLEVVRDGAEGEAARRYKAKLVLVRPDHFVAWSRAEGEIRPSAEEILTRAAGSKAPRMFYSKDAEDTGSGVVDQSAAA